MKGLLPILALFFAVELGGAEKVPEGFYRLSVVQTKTGANFFHVTLSMQTASAEAFGLYYANGGKLRTKLQPEGDAAGSITLTVEASKEALLYEVREKVECGTAQASGMRKVPLSGDLTRAIQFRLENEGLYKVGTPLVIWTINGEPVVLFTGKWDEKPVPAPITL